MKKTIFFIASLGLYLFLNSCSSSLDFSETVTIIDEQNTNTDGGGEGNGGGTGDGDGGTSENTDTLGFTLCESGFADIYPCSNYNLMSWMSTSIFGSSIEGNDCWGWTDPSTSKEYAIYGVSDGTAFIDISDPSNPIYIGRLEGNGTSSWRDIKVYNNYAYIVSEASGHGMQVFDLSLLAGITDFPTELDEVTIYSGFGNAHNIVINTDSGYAYAVGTDTYSGGAHFIDLQNPANPVEAGGYSGSSTHDAQVVIYNGPDLDYTGKEIFFGCNQFHVEIVDVTDKSNPVLISIAEYSNVGYTHQGWLTDNQRFFIVGDELDELNNGTLTKTIVFDLEDLDNPIFHFDYTASNSSIDHNGYVNGNTFYLSSYTAGLRSFDISDIENFDMFETGYFDIFPENDNAEFHGAWSVYPYFSSGNIIISGIDDGLFIVKKQ